MIPPNFTVHGPPSITYDDVDGPADDVTDKQSNDTNGDVTINYEDDKCKVPPPLPPRRSQKPSLKKGEIQQQPKQKETISDAEKNAFTPMGNQDGLSQTLKPSLQNELRARMNEMRFSDKS